jgi:hypothetical protein
MLSEGYKAELRRPTRPWVGVRIPLGTDPYGGCSSDWSERRVVAPKVAGSSPVIHPNNLRSLGSIFNFLFCDGQ